VFLIDSNVLIDAENTGAVASAWSEAALDRLGLVGPLMIDAIVHAEVLARGAALARIDKLLSEFGIKLADLPFAAGAVAARAYAEYRARGGSKLSLLPDFLIGAHAEVAGLTVVTRDPRPYRTYFPAVALVAP
jgi:hypothetical protein